MNTLFAPRPGGMVWVWALGATLVFVAFFAFLNTLPGRQKRNLTVAVTFLAGLFYFLEFMLPPGFLHRPAPGDQDNVLSLALTPLSDFFAVIGAMAFGLGLLNLFTIHGRNLTRLRTGWINSLVFFVGFFCMAVAGISHDRYPDNAFWTGAYNFFFAGLYQSLAASVFALLAFFIASAAFRAFRISSVESTLMMITAFIVMLGNVGSEVLTGQLIPVGSPLEFLRLDNLTFWIMSTVNMSAQRALLFGIAMGEIAIALRVWLSLERGHFFDQEV